MPNMTVKPWRKIRDTNDLARFKLVPWQDVQELNYELALGIENVADAKRVLLKLDQILGKYGTLMVKGISISQIN
ncbi:hypothetical protein K9N68_14005 [Kovacikia minuta CCNUW1]|uniref:hypothetical protein n=1 Tax=Kovacikia minuta TaxID=2931930 RepID=UPI001CCB43DD|nr:hypothetical protein [Kovacikia minuta]UBF29756.1 hypothetical protein K9N68_14005 [Kovacikia minuta CCNUW1]